MILPFFFFQLPCCKSYGNTINEHSVFSSKIYIENITFIHCKTIRNFRMKSRSSEMWRSVLPVLPGEVQVIYWSSFFWRPTILWIVHNAVTRSYSCLPFNTIQVNRKWIKDIGQTVVKSKIFFFILANRKKLSWFMGRTSRILLFLQWISTLYIILYL